jgi:endonuclease-3
MESLKSKQRRAIAIYETLLGQFDDLSPFLFHRNAFELLVAVILSAQCTDERINKVTPALFAAFPTPKALSEAPIEQVMALLKSVNFFRAKSANIIKTAHDICTRFNGQVPSALDDLITLAGVGRKTANVVLGQYFGEPGITVDTHVKRVTNRWKFSNSDDATHIEFDLAKIWPKETWIDFSTVTILHGRRTCKAIKPLCGSCPVSQYCPSYRV